MKKLLTIAASTLMAALFAFTSCSEKSQAKKIGVIQLVQHSALDAAYNGFVDQLKVRGYEDGKNIKIDYQNASGEQANCVTIANQLVSERNDLILAIATPAAQAVANATESIPVLITAVTDPASANLVDSNELPGRNVTGTSDLTPCAAQIDLIKQLFPEAKHIAIMYCSSEENSIVQANLAIAECEKIGLTYETATVSNTNEIQQVTQSLVGKVDAIYIPTDNMMASSIATVSMITNEAKIPVICGEDGMTQGGGLCTYGINYYELGKLTGDMAADILEGKSKPETTPIQYLQHFDFSYNADTAEALGIEFPADL
jgi:putative ABC transport system substrate-binding protein